MKISNQISLFWINAFIVSLILYSSFLFGTFSFIYLTSFYLFINYFLFYKKGYKKNIYFFILFFFFSIHPIFSFFYQWDNHSHIYSHIKAKFFLLLSLLTVQFLLSFLTLFLFQFISNINQNHFEKNKQSTKINFYFPLIFICCLGVFFTLSNFAPIEVDASRHSLNSFKIFDLLFHEKNLTNVFFFYDFYGPVVYIVGAIFMFIFGKNENALILSMILFWLPISYYSLYHFIVNFFYNKKEDEIHDKKIIASIITFILIGSPMAIGMSKQYMLEIPQLAFTCLFLFLIEKTNYFQKKKIVFVLGAIFGLSFLCKASAVFYSFPFFISYLIITILFIFQNKEKKQESFISLVFSLFVFCFGFLSTAGIWLLGNFDLFLFELKGQKEHGIGEGDPYPFSLESFIYYFSILEHYFEWLVFLIFCFGAFISIFAFRKKKQLKKIIPLVFSFLFIYFFFTLRWNKDPRYIIGILPFCSIGFVGFFELIKNQNLIKRFNQYYISLMAKVIIVLAMLSTYFSNIGQVFNFDFKLLPYSQSAYTLPHSFISSTNKNSYKTIVQLQLNLNQLSVESKRINMNKPYVPYFYQTLHSSQNSFEKDSAEYLFKFKKNEIHIDTNVNFKQNKKIIFMRTPLWNTASLFVFEKKNIANKQSLFLNTVTEGTIKVDYFIEKINIHFKNGKILTLNNIFVDKNKKEIWQGKQKISKIEVIKIKCFYHQQKWQMLLLAQFAKMYPLDFMTKSHLVKVFKSNSYFSENNKVVISY